MMSRRGLLASVPGVAAALAVLVGYQHRLWRHIDVRDFGARGDGVTDDSEAIQTAARALRSGGTLYFPRGTYRFVRRSPPGAAAIVIDGVSDVLVEFEPGAELLMDNVDPDTRTGTSHGVLVRGPGSGITLRNIDVRWATRTERSLGDGIRVEGWPGSAVPDGWSGRPTPVAGVVVADCRVRASPQAGVIVFGASDVTVTGLRVEDTGADGLHFNACRRAEIDDVGAVNTGDDGIALVTYFAPEFSFDEVAHTFAFPELGDWSNAGFVISDVGVDGGRANGIRVAGAHRVTVAGLRVTGVRSGSAVMVDAAEPGADVGWNYVASRAIRVDDVTATNCDTGIHLLARSGGPGDQRFTDFDVRVDDATLNDCGNWAVQAESLTKHEVTGLRVGVCAVSSTATTGGNGGVGLTNAARISLGDISIRHSSPVVVFKGQRAREFTLDRLSVAISAAEVPVEPIPPCVSLDASDGVIDELDVSWPAAPESWSAVRLDDSTITSA